MLLAILPHTIYDDGEVYLAKLFSLETMEHFRNMILVLRSEGLCYRAGFHMNPKIWDKPFSKTPRSTTDLRTTLVSTNARLGGARFACSM
ncbi:Uncharacterized protein HZ326_29443 [Fusarium oxysporum f. sp. albedinis]|nr:Uncharacterized protein HZ326_29443 [Fusarium oxysporum f. sp. albedinis]